MKKMSFAVWFTALLTVFSLSSCLDSDDNATRQASEIVKVSGYMGFYTFESAGGYQIIPRNQSSLVQDISSRYAYIAYSYNGGDVTPEMKKISVDLLGVMPINEQGVSGSTENMEDFANAPIRNITAGAGYEFFPITFWDANTMFLPINYFIRDVSSEEDLKQEASSHSFDIFFDVNESKFKGEDLILHVRHNVRDEALNKERNSRINTDIFHIDLSYVLSEHKAKYDRLPKHIYVEYENSLNGSYKNDEGEKLTKSTNALIEYEEILKAIEQDKK